MTLSELQFFPAGLKLDLFSVITDFTIQNFKNACEFFFLLDFRYKLESDVHIKTEITVTLDS